MNRIRQKEKFWWQLKQARYIDGLIAERNMDHKEEMIESAGEGREEYGQMLAEMEALVEEVLAEYRELGFENIPSIEIRRDVEEMASFSPVKRRGEAFLKISLMDHTLHVLSLARKIPLRSEIDRPMVVFSALFHDAGKSRNLCARYGIRKGAAHEKKSGAYAHAKLKDTRFSYLAKPLSRVFNLKRLKYRGQKISFYGKILETLDKAAREYELQLVESGGKGEEN